LLEPEKINGAPLDATRDRIFLAAERLFALRGFADVSVRDITSEAGVNLAAVNYHFGSRDALLFEIFRTRGTELNRLRVRMLHEAMDAYDNKPPVRAILEALITPPLRWFSATSDRFVAMQFLVRTRSEGTAEIREALRSDVSHLTRFAEALMAARPDLPSTEVYWRLHFTLGLVHQNRETELERLRLFSHGLAEDGDIDGHIRRMVDFAEAGFNA